jgi:hypothetical protein
MQPRLPVPVQLSGGQHRGTVINCPVRQGEVAEQHELSEVLFITVPWISSSDQTFSSTSAGSCSLHVDGSTDHTDTHTHTHTHTHTTVADPGLREVLAEGVELPQSASTALIFER